MMTRVHCTEGNKERTGEIETVLSSLIYFLYYRRFIGYVILSSHCISDSYVNEPERM
jgi:hypothetical protein